MTPIFVSTAEELHELCERLSGATALALDTEFVRVRTYFPVLCLIQITDGETISCIDTVSLQDLTALMDLIDGCSDALTLHAGRQDFEALYQRTGRLPAAVWDTQIAAALLDHGDQVSYAQLVKLLAGVELDKSHTRTNWARRPLSAGQLRYAAEDVYYLPQIRSQFEQRLVELGRLEWLEEDCLALLDVGNYEPAYDNAWRRCKLRRRLNPEQRGAWKLLCGLRERKAADTDRPRRWVLEDAALEELACLTTSQGNNIDELLGSGRIRRQLDGQRVREILTDPEPANDGQRARPDPEQQALIDSCVADVRSIASDLGVSASLLATRKDLTMLVRGDRAVGLLRGWRRQVVGERLLTKIEETIQGS